LEDLEMKLRRTPLPTLSPVMGERVAEGRVRVIVTEAVFSMEGDVCPLYDLLNLAQKYDALVYLDEAHAVGVFGKEGEGLAPRHPPENLICMGTLGKAFGSYGAFVAGSRSLRDYLINKARSFIFTTSLPPAALGASLESVRIVRREPERRQKLWENVRLVQRKSPIISIPIGDARKTMAISQRLLEEGFYVQGIRPPTVPEGTSRLRLTVSAVHTPEQIESILRSIRSLCTF
jgi:8-amino-7-oxononanoate synthase